MTIPINEENYNNATLINISILILSLLPETITILLISYTPMQNKKFKKIRVETILDNLDTSKVDII